MRHTRAHTKNRRSHHKIKEPRLSVCSKCSAYHVRHRVCGKCGMYRGKQLLDFSARQEKEEKKKKQKETKNT